MVYMVDRGGAVSMVRVVTIATSLCSVCGTKGAVRIERKPGRAAVFPIHAGTCDTIQDRLAAVTRKWKRHA